MKLCEYLAAENLSASQMAARLGVSVSSITRLLNGARRPSLEFAARIAEATGGAVTPNDFAGIGAPKTEAAE